MRLRGAPLDNLPLLDAYWTVYAWWLDGVPQEVMPQALAIIDAAVDRETPREDGLTKDDVDYLAQLGLTPEDLRRTTAQRRREHEEHEDGG